MANTDLRKIQSLLKAAIQNHQVAVGKLKNDPENVSLKKDLHKLQSEITSLSDQQKAIIQTLRKDILTKQSSVQTITTSVKPQVSTNINNQLKAKVQAVQITAANLSLKSSAITTQSTIKTVQKQAITPIGQNGSPISFILKPSVNNSNQQANVIMAPTQTINYPQSVVFSLTPAQKQSSAVSICNSLKNVQISTRPVSPLIRVPSYVSHRPPLQQTKSDVNQIQSLHISEFKRSNSTNTNELSSFSHKPPDLLLDIKDYVTEKKQQLTAEEKEKLQYMSALELVTHDVYRELQNKRFDRKRRRTANPQFSHSDSDMRRKKETPFMFNPRHSEITRKKVARIPKPVGKLLASSPVKSRSPSPYEVFDQPKRPESIDSQSLPDVDDMDFHDDCCALCHRVGELLMCDTCSLVYHLNCLDPPLTSVPQGFWSCPQCVVIGKDLRHCSVEKMTAVQNYVARKSVKEQEKRRLKMKSTELSGQKEVLEMRLKQLTHSIDDAAKTKEELSSSNVMVQQNVDSLKNIIKYFHAQ